MRQPIDPAPILARLRALRAAVLADSTSAGRYALGARWYHEQRVRLARLADDADHVEERVLAAAATLSPANNWANLVDRLPQFLADVDAGQPVPAFPTYGRNRWKAARMLAGWIAPDACATGQKVRPFWRALSGCPFAVVVDRHTCRQALGPGRDIPTARELRAIRLAFLALGHETGERPRDIQAALWTAAVGTTGLRAGERAHAIPEPLPIERVLL